MLCSLLSRQCWINQLILPKQIQGKGNLNMNTQVCSIVIKMSKKTPLSLICNYLPTASKYMPFSIGPRGGNDKGAFLVGDFSTALLDK